MGKIKRLPEAVRNTVRSGIFLFDLTRVVEELVFNSLDAGATKVSVFVGVGTCYVKVMDNGSGICRDGLELVGERYATSKLHRLADVDASSTTFGFRGEALASIANVSLLEIITKAYGRPNGYRKVMKGSECLYLQIDNERTDVGTTVVARDLFYNQPVRRNYIQFSPKKVLHSVKKCVFRIALVHSQVSFNVVDIESEDELLITRSSASPLPLMMRSFGIENSGFLHEVNANDGVLKISGYISSPSASISIKDVQYVYINSQFVCKGPIHKLLNQLAASFYCLDSWKASNGSDKRKRSRFEACPTYILNLHCPHTLYDLNFEPSKTYVVFKDWKPVVTFVEKAIRTVWMKNIAFGESFSCAPDKVGEDEVWRKCENIILPDLFDADMSEDAVWELESSRFQNHQASLHLPSSPFKDLTEEDNDLFTEEHKKITFREFHKYTAEHEEENNEMEFFCQPDYSFRSLEGSVAECLPVVSQKVDHDPRTADNKFSSTDTYFLDNSFSAAGGSSIHVDGNLINSQQGKECLKVESDLSNELSESALSFDRDKFSNELEVSKDITNPFQQSCSLEGYWPFGGPSFVAEERHASSIGSFKHKRKQICWDERTDFVEADVSNQNFDLFSKSRWQSAASCSQQLPRLMMERDVPTDPFPQASSWDDGHFTNKIAPEGNSRLEAANYRPSADAKEKCKYSYDFTLRSPNQGKCTPASTGSDFNEYDHSNKDFYKFLQDCNLPDKCSLEHCDRLTDETQWLCSVSCSKNFGESERQRDQSRYQICEPNPIPKERSRRSHSAPPFHRHKRKYISLNHCSRVQCGKLGARTFNYAESSPEAGVLKHLQQSSGVCHINIEPSLVEDFEFSPRPYMKKSNTPLHMKETQKGEKSGQFECAQAHHAADVEDLISMEIPNSVGSGTKWRNSRPQTTNKTVSCNIHQEDTIIDISSGLLHLAGNSLIPESVQKNCFEDAKVLQQVDKKFIPVVAGGTLAVIDQHAADERIRLEELRQKVLSGEGKTVTYLDAEQELVLPEIGYQLLHNYAEQIKDWGWICNIHAHGSKSFKKNLNILHQQPTVATLFAVPCILGVNLSDADLLEFLQQLSDTDGSSTIPPSVLRVLNSKACRGAIMFGDSLLPSECALIVEELKQTSLCFQCAHGRPTTVPLVNLEALHKQIAQLGALNHKSSEPWHGLCHHGISLERASQRLSAARVTSMS
ncbi:DNA mismatch repair protein MLH3 [Melia azedarach]|uniref:DNA mismatch repair protein MLH3 n=1 Tax=Melia azedarach TaxID=155640 RepID=A0ACC1XSG3_MELAZ|nr:DNA mismatch repair protein MLH3 [Melia azedarach]